MIELARMQVIPICPKCGKYALFQRRDSVAENAWLRGVECECGWMGVSQTSIPQPKIEVFQP